MAEPTPSPRDILAETMEGGRKVVVPYLAEMLKRTGITEVDSEEERRRFWQRAMTPEQETLLWHEEMVRRGISQLVPGSPEVLEIGLGISKQVYPDRWDMLTGEGRAHQSDQARWAWKLARRGPPEGGVGGSQGIGDDTQQSVGRGVAPLAADASVRTPVEGYGSGGSAAVEVGPVVPQTVGQPPV